MKQVTINYDETTLRVEGQDYQDGELIALSSSQAFHGLLGSYLAAYHQGPAGLALFDQTGFAMVIPKGVSELNQKLKDNATNVTSTEVN